MDKDISDKSIKELEDLVDLELDDLNDNNDSFCQCCGNVLRNYRILVCFDCLGIEASEFRKKTESLKR
jgi:hypothetical protein